MEKEFGLKHMKMSYMINTKEIILMIKRMDMEYLNGLMVVNSLDNFMKIINMEQEK